MYALFISDIMRILEKHRHYLLETVTIINYKFHQSSFIFINFISVT